MNEEVENVWGPFDPSEIGWWLVAQDYWAEQDRYDLSEEARDNKNLVLPTDAVGWMWDDLAGWMLHSYPDPVTGFVRQPSVSGDYNKQVLYTGGWLYLTVDEDTGEYDRNYYDHCMKTRYQLIAPELLRNRLCSGVNFF